MTYLFSYPLLFRFLPQFDDYYHNNQDKSNDSSYNHGYNQYVSPYPNLEDKHTKFWNTEPPMFSKTMNHLEADDWITTIEQKLDMVQCNDTEKVLFASGQLIEAALEWWNSYIYEHEEPQSIVWKELKDNFISHFIPVSVMKLKRANDSD
jgi:hypothetical protein